MPAGIEEAEEEKAIRIPSYPENFGPTRLHRVSVGYARAKQNQGFNDVLAQTFDVRDMEAAE